VEKIRNTPEWKREIISLSKRDDTALFTIKENNKTTKQEERKTR